MKGQGSKNRPLDSAREFLGLEGWKKSPLPPPAFSQPAPDASAQQLVSTFYLPSGIGATCVLKSAFNSTLDQQVQSLNLNSNESKMLAAKYFDAVCLDSFTQGLPLSNFVPPPPSPAPSNYPFSLDEDLLRAWNSTTSPPTVKGEGGPGWEAPSRGLALKMARPASLLRLGGAPRTGSGARRGSGGTKTQTPA